MEVGAQRAHGPVQPVHVGEVPDHPALSYGHEFVVPVREARVVACGEPRYEVGQHQHVPIHRIGVDLHPGETAVRLQVTHGVLDGLYALPGMDFLDDPSGIVPEEPPGVDEPEEEAVEVRGQLPVVRTLSPGVEDEVPADSPAFHELGLDVPDDAVVRVVGLHRQLHHLLGRGDDEVGNPGLAPCLLPDQSGVCIEPVLGACAIPESGVVHTVGAVEGPAVGALGPEVMVAVVAAGGEHGCSVLRPDEAATLPLRTGEVVSGKRPGDEELPGTKETENLGREAGFDGSLNGHGDFLFPRIMCMLVTIGKLMVRYGRIQRDLGGIAGKGLDIGSDPMTEKGVLLGTGLESGLLYGSLERAHMRLELPIIVVFECQHGTLRGHFHRASAALIRSFTVGTRKTAGGRGLTPDAPARPVWLRLGRGAPSAPRGIGVVTGWEAGSLRSPVPTDRPLSGR